MARHHENEDCLVVVTNKVLFIVKLCKNCKLHDNFNIYIFFAFLDKEFQYYSLIHLFVICTFQAGMIPAINFVHLKHCRFDSMFLVFF